MNGFAKFVLFLLIATLLAALAWSLMKAANVDAAAVEEPDCPWPRRLFTLFFPNVQQCSGKHCFYGGWDNPVEPVR